MNNSGKKFGADWSVAAAIKGLEDLGSQVKRTVDVRMKRGDVRSAVLRLLHEAPMHGYQIIHEIESRSNGAWTPSPGSVYPTLQLLVDEGLITSTEADGRRTYSLTDTGTEAAAAESETPAPWNVGIAHPSGPRGNLAVAGVHLAKAAADVARTGTTEQIDRATALIDEATHALTALMSQD